MVYVLYIDVVENGVLRAERMARSLNSHELEVKDHRSGGNETEY